MGGEQSKKEAASQKNPKNQMKPKQRKSMLNAITMVVSRFGVRIIIYSLIAILFYYGITRAYAFGYRVFTTRAVSAEPGVDVLVNIQKDMTNDEIGELLESKGLVRDASVFVVQAALYTNSKYQIQPGTYTLNTSLTPKDMIAIMTVEPEVEEETTALALGQEKETGGTETQPGETNGQ